MELEVEFLSNEHFETLNSLDKSSVRGDLVANIKNISKNKDIANKIIIELQPTKDTTMGFRMCINVADTDIGT